MWGYSILCLYGCVCVYINACMYVQMTERYEQGVQERNDLGLQLIERNEEVCVFYEKLNVQESVIRAATMKLESREEELSFLKAEVGGGHASPSVGVSV